MAFKTATSNSIAAGNDGSPNGKLVQGANGALYGTVSSGPTGSYGGVFRINPDGTGYTLIKQFDGADGRGNPRTGLIRGIDGAMYGLVYGSNSAVFRIKPDGTGYTVLANLPIALTGIEPLTELVQSPDGTLYGMTPRFGGGGGSIFKLNPDGTGLVKLINMPEPPTQDCKNNLILGSDGVLYGSS